MTIATTDILTFVSIIVLAYTAIQALKSRKATAQAAILTVLPILYVEFKTFRDTTGWEVDQLEIRNDGNGPAFSVRIEDVTFDFLDVDDRWTLKMGLEPDHLISKGTNTLGTRVVDKNGDDTDAAAFMTQRIRHRTSPVSLVILFKDVTGKRYVTLVETGNGIARVRRPSAPYGLRLRCKYGLWYPILNFMSRRKNSVLRSYEMKIRPKIDAWRTERLAKKKDAKKRGKSK